MIERIEGLPDGIDGVRCAGKLTREDYDAVVVPLLDEVEREHRGLRCVVEIAWLEGLSSELTIAHRVLADAGVVVVEVVQPLRPQDVEELATVVDGWLTEHSTLHGLVLHARTFPGWKNIGGLVQHLQFIIGHHRHLDRVALAVDGPLATVAATFASWSPIRGCGASPSTSGMRP